MLDEILKWCVVAVCLFPWSLLLWVIFFRRHYYRRYHPKTDHLRLVQRERDPEDFSC